MKKEIILKVNGEEREVAVDRLMKSLEAHYSLEEPDSK